MHREYLDWDWIDPKLAMLRKTREDLRDAFNMKKGQFDKVVSGEAGINGANIDRMWKLLDPHNLEDRSKAFRKSLIDHSKHSIADAADPVDRETARVQLTAALRANPGQILYSSIGDAGGIRKLVDEFLSREPLVKAIVLKKMSDYFLSQLEGLGVVEKGLRKRMNANLESLRQRPKLKVECYDWPALPPFYGLYYATYFRFGRWYVEDSNPPYLTVDNTPTWIFRPDAIDKHPLFIRYRDLMTEVPTTKPRRRVRK